MIEDLCLNCSLREKIFNWDILHGHPWISEATSFFGMIYISFSCTKKDVLLMFGRHKNNRSVPVTFRSITVSIIKHVGLIISPKKTKFEEIENVHFMLLFITHYMIIFKGSQIYFLTLQSYM